MSVCEPGAARFSMQRQAAQATACKLLSPPGLHSSICKTALLTGAWKGAS